MTHQQGWSLKARSKASRTPAAGWGGRPGQGQGSAVKAPTAVEPWAPGLSCPGGFPPLCPPKATLLSEATAPSDSRRWRPCP